MSETLTRGIRIIVRPREGDETVQLLSRHWVITAGDGKVEEVRGPGVVGYQPILQPGEEFQYTSGCPLKAPVGTMHGEFNMVVQASGEAFDARISPFRLAVPGVLN
jgi:ApaG protein